MSAAVLIAGGYGAVGQVVSAELALADRAQIVIAGRDRARAEAVAARLGEQARGTYLDLTDPESYPAALEGIGSVVVCVEQDDTRFVEACLLRGLDYVDISASYDFLQRVEALDSLASKSGSRCILSVGLAPGVTNLLARRVIDSLDRVERVDIQLLLGLGDVHGPAAIEWMLERAHAPYTVGDGANARVLHPFADPRRVELPPYGRRVAYGFDFSDQHVVRRTLGIPEARTRLCFDSAFVTRVLAMLARLGALRLLRWRRARALTAAVLDRMRFGSSTFVVRVDAIGVRNGRTVQASELVSGDGESTATGVVAAFVVESLRDCTSAGGVFHIEQRVDAGAALARLADRGFVVTTHRP